MIQISWKLSSRDLRIPNSSEMETSMLSKPIHHLKGTVFVILASLSVLGMLVSCSTSGTSGSTDDRLSGLAGESSGGDDALTDGSSGEDSPLETCPQGPIFLDIEMIEAWTWSPGGIRDIGEIEGWGKVTCTAEISGSTVTGEVGCFFEYFNEGYIQGDPGRCDIKGQGVAIATIKGSCDNFTVTLEIDETVEPDDETGDIPMSAQMTCDKQTYPYLTYFPFTWFKVEVPLASGEFEYALGKDDCPHDFVACDKLYYFRIRNPEYQE
jgi:hypothetical protein